MSLLQNNPLFNSLISFSKNGIEVANYMQIRNAITTRYKEIYGSDVDLSTSTADGQYVEMICLIINNTLQSFKTFYSNLDVHTAQGRFLEVLAALTNVSRKAATRSTASITVTLKDRLSLSVGPIYLGAEIESLDFLDKNGTEWNFKPTEVVTFTQDVATTIVAECSELGPVRADAGWIDRLIDASIVMEISSAKAEVGQYEESDAELRTRRLQLLGQSGTTVLQSLSAALLAIEGIEDVKIYNNDTSANVTTKDGITVPIHDVAIVIKKSQNAQIADSVIGSIIYEKMTPGIKTVDYTGVNASYGTAKSYQYVQRVQGQAIQTGVLQTVYWKEAKVISSSTNSISITITPNEFYSTTTTQLIADAVMQRVNSARIGENIEHGDILVTVLNTDPLFKGYRTFTASTGTISISTTFLSNKDMYCNLTNVVVSNPTATTIRITLS